MTDIRAIRLESAASDGSTQASSRVSIDLPMQGCLLRFSAFDATARTLVSARHGWFDGTNLWLLQSSIPTNTMGTVVWGIAPFPVGVTFPNGLRTFVIEPNAALTIGRRMLVVGTIEGTF